jgi:hypothetical protein
VQDIIDPAPARLPRAILFLGCFFLVAVTVATVMQGAVVLRGQLMHIPTRIGGDGVAVVLFGAAGIAAAMWVGLLMGRSRLSDRQILIGGLLAVLLARGATVLLMNSPVPNDGLVYQELARDMLHGACCFADRPTGYPAVLAAAYALLGDGTWVHEWLNVVAAVIGGGLMFGLAREGLGRGAASVALLIYAVLPTQLLLTPVLLTDTVYATLLIGLCWSAMRMAGGGLAAALASGALVAASQYVRPVGPALLLGVALVPLLFVRPMRRGLLVLAVLVLSFGALMTPAVVRNLSEHGDLSVSTSSYGGWSLLMGTNQQKNGRYNAEDAALVNSLPGDDFWERSNAAGELGMERITSDPIGFAGLALRKFRIMWGTEDFGVAFGFRPVSQPRHALGGLVVVSQLAYLLVVLAALWAMVVAIRLRTTPVPLVIAVIAVLVCVALVHTFLEVKPRYHAQMEPLLLLLASPILARLRLGERWRPWHTAEAAPR